MNTKLLAVIEPVVELLATQCKKLGKTFEDVDLQILVDETCKETDTNPQLVNLVATQIKAIYNPSHKTVDDTITAYMEGCRMATESSIELEELRLSAGRYFQMCERYGIKLDTPVVDVVKKISKYANALVDNDVRRLFIQVGLLINKAAKIVTNTEEIKGLVYQEIETKYGNK